MRISDDESFWDELIDKLKRLFSVDLRSLALFRISLALVIFYDLYVRSLTLVRDYTDFGALPRAPLIEKFGSVWRLSIHLMSGLAYVEIFLFLLAAFFAFMLLVGFRSRFATLASWAMMMSLQARNPMVLQAGDVFFRMSLFFAIFMPLGARFSIDAIIESHRKPARENLPAHCFSFAAVGLLFQVAFVYWFTATIKLSGNSAYIWWSEATAVYYALNIDQFLLPLGYFFRSLPMEFLQWLARGVILVEIIAPVLLFWPIFPGAARILSILLFVGLHAGFGLCLNLGPFPLVSVTAVLPFVPSLVWDRWVAGWWSGVKWKDRVYQTLRESSYLKELAVRPRGWVVLDRICRGKENAFSHVGLPRSIDLILVFVILYIFLWNLGAVYPSMEIRQPYRRIGAIFGFEQTWNMFSPPLRDDGWYVIPGKLKNGNQIDVFRDGLPVSWEKPKHVVDTYKSERTRKYMMNIYLASNKEHRLYYGKYLCRNWNKHHQGGEQLETFQIVFMRERTLPGGKTPKVEKVTIWNHRCFDTPAPAKSPAKKA